MQVCMNCFQELFDSDIECIKCRSKQILSTEEYKECKKFFMYHDKDLKRYPNHPYSTYIKYLNHKNKMEKFEYDKLHPSYTISVSKNPTSNVIADSAPDSTPALKCPKCNSTSVSTTARGVNAFWGFIGASKTVNRCGNCGYTWKPNGK